MEDKVYLVLINIIGNLHVLLVSTTPSEIFFGIRRWMITSNKVYHGCYLYQQLMGPHLCDCWLIWSAQYNSCRHGKLSKGFVRFILFAWQCSCTYVKHKGSNLFTLTKCFINNCCFLFATSIAMPIYRVFFSYAMSKACQYASDNAKVYRASQTCPIHVFVLLQYFNNVFKGGANEMLLQSSIWCCDKGKGRIWCVKVKIERGRLGCVKMKMKKRIKNLVW